MTKQAARRKVGPARLAKSNHRFVNAKVRNIFTIEEIQSIIAMQLSQAQDPEPSPVPEGSVEDGDPEPTQTSTNKESGTVPVSTLVFNIFHDSPTELFSTIPLSLTPL